MIFLIPILSKSRWNSISTGLSARFHQGGERGFSPVRFQEGLGTMRKVSLIVVAGFTFSVVLFAIATRAQSSDWNLLFNGKDLTGWKHVGPGGDTVEDGLIKTHGGMGLLYWTGGKLGKCRIRVVYKMRDFNDNSGFFIRISIQPHEPWMHVHYRY